MQTFDPRLLALRDGLCGQVLEGTNGVRYHLRHRIGEGGQGWVFRANWGEPEGYEVVVKVLRPDSVTPESLARFEREAQVLRMLGQATRPNPHIVRYFDHATARLPVGAGGPVDLPFTVLEYVRGPTLEDILATTPGAGLALERVRRIARQVAAALEDVHARKIVHRDLKPSNVLLATEGGAEIAKVTDFGIVKFFDGGVVRTAALAGATMGYAPPEQFERRNLRVDARTDVFSYAAMLYEMLTGEKAFPRGEGENPLIVITRLLNGPRPSLLNATGVLSPELAPRRDAIQLLDAAIVRATAAEPSERQGSIGGLWNVLEPLLHTGSGYSDAPAVAGDLLPDPNGWPPLAGGQPGGETASTAEAGPRERPAEPQPSSPLWWSWRVRVPSVRAGSVRAAAFDVRGEGAIAVGPDGVMRLDEDAWSATPLAQKIDLRLARGLGLLPGGELLVFGARGLAAQPWSPDSTGTWDFSDTETTFLGAHVDDDGTVTLVGERPLRQGGSAHGTTGTIAQFFRGKRTLVTDAPLSARLRAVTRLAAASNAGIVVACGDRGAIVRLERGVPEHVGEVCAGHLTAIAAVGDGAVTVGSGGHALSLSARLQAQLEAVQTTRDLLALAVDPAGIAWAGSAQARILRRTGGSWLRMSGELGLTSSVVALWAGLRRVRAVCDDGAVVEGTLVAPG